MRIENNESMQKLTKYFSESFENLEKKIVDYLFDKKILNNQSVHWGTRLGNIIEGSGASTSSHCLYLFGKVPPDIVKAFSDILIYTFASKKDVVIRGGVAVEGSFLTGLNLTKGFLPKAYSVNSLINSVIQEVVIPVIDPYTGRRLGNNFELHAGGSFLAQGDISAFSVNPPSINWWDGMPSASDTIQGGIVLGEGLEWNPETGKVDATGIGGFEGDHNDLSGLQGGTTNQYYHMTAAQHGRIDNWDTAYSYVDDILSNVTQGFIPYVYSVSKLLRDSNIENVSGGIEVTGNVEASGDVSAFASDPPAINWWDDMPSANDTIQGGIILGSGLEWNPETGKVDVTAVGGFEGAHNDLTGLQGGISNQYYHMTAAQHGRIDNWDTSFSYIDDLTTNLTQDYIPYAYSVSKLLRDSNIKNVSGGIEVTGNVEASGDVSAFASDPPAINWWDDMPSASDTIQGGIVLGDGLEWNPLTGKVDITAIGGFEGAHNDLSGLQGGTTNQYYHLSLADYNKRDNWDTAFSYIDALALTDKYIPKANITGLLVDSIIYEDGGEIVVGGNILSSGDVSAFASDPPAINWWDDMPSASDTIQGGIVLGDGLEWNAVTGKVDVTGIGGGSFEGDHNDLSGLNVGDYRHLTAAQYGNIDNWDTAYSLRMQWDGGSTNLVAATGRTSLDLNSYYGQLAATNTWSAKNTFEDELEADNNVSHSDFSLTTDHSGTNWRITAAGDANFNNVVVRGSARFRELIIDQLSVIAGSQLLSVARGKIKDVWVGDSMVVLEDPRGTEATTFAVDDFFWIKSVDIDGNAINNITGQIESIHFIYEGVTGVMLKLDIDEGAIGDIQVGDVIVQRGHPTDTDRQALIYTTVSDSDAPVIKFLTAVDSLAAFNDTGSISTVLGNLGGLSYGGEDSVFANVEGEGLFSSRTYLTDLLLVGDLDKVGSYMEYAYGELTLRGKIIANEGEIAGWVIADGDISKVGGTDDKEKVVISSADRCIRFLYDDEERVAFSADEIPAFEDIVDAGTIFGRDGFYSYWDADRFFYLTSVGGKSLIEAKGVMYFYAPSDTEVNYANIGITSAGISIMAAGTKYVTCTLPTSNPGANRLWVDTANNNVLKLGT